MANYGSSPTWAEIWTRLTKKGIKPYMILHAVACRNSLNLIDLIDENSDPMEGPHGNLQRSELRKVRASLNAAQRRCYNAVVYAIRDAGRFIGSVYPGEREILRDLYDYCITNSYMVKRRGKAYGAPTAGGSNVGNPTIISVSTDEEGYAIERGGPFAPGTSWDYRMEVIEDGAELGVEGRHRVRVYSDDAPATDLSVDSQGLAAGANIEFDSLDSRDTVGINNADFSQYVSGGSPPFTSWWAAAYTGITQDTTSGNGYLPTRGTRSASNTTGTYSSMALATTATNAIWQYVTQPIDDSCPWVGGFWIKASTTVNIGTVTVTFGSKSYVWTPASTDYTFIYPGITNPEYHWWRQFRDNPLKIQIQRTGAPTAGTIYVDSCIIAPLSDHYYNGRYLASIEGSTECDEEDVWTMTDTVSADPGEAQSFFAMFFDTYLPHALVASTNMEDYS